MVRRKLKTLSAVCPLLGLWALAGAGGCEKLANMDMYNQPKHRPETKSDFFENQSSARPLVAGTIPRPDAPPDRAGQPGSGIGSITLDVAMGPTSPTGTPGAEGSPASTASPLPSEYLKLTPSGFPPDFPTGGVELQEKIARGQERFNIYCSVCHGYNGQGDGMIVQRGFTRPPAFFPLERDKTISPEMYARELAFVDRNVKPAFPAHVYDVITGGLGAMFSYGDRVPPTDRWAIAAYIVALQQAKPALTTPGPAANIGPDEVHATSP